MVATMRCGQIKHRLRYADNFCCARNPSAVLIVEWHSRSVLVGATRIVGLRLDEPIHTAALCNAARAASRPGNHASDN